MNTQPTNMRLLLTAAAILLVAQACVSHEAMVDPTVADPAKMANVQAMAKESEPRVEESKPTMEPPAENKIAEPEAPSLMAAGANPAKQLTPAKTVTDIDVQRQSDRLIVLVTGDGELTYQAMKLDGNRLIVDLMDVVNGTKRKSILVGHQMVRQIRIGVHQFPQAKVRLVLDLERAVPYSIEKTDTQIKITLTSQAGQPGSQEAINGVRPSTPSAEKEVGGASRKTIPSQVPLPERLKLLDPITALAQPKSPQTPDVASLPVTGQFTGKRISLDFQDADISSVLRLIADVSGLNMVVGEAVKAKVTLKLLNVPWDQALDLLLKLNNLGQIRDGNIIWIDTLTNITKLRDEAVKAKDASVKAEELVTRIVYLNFAEANKSLDVAKSNLSPRGEIKVDSRTNALVVRDIADNVGKVEKIIRDLDQRTPQVQIEARIVQASKSFARGLGVQWFTTPISFAGAKSNYGIVPGTLTTASSGTTFTLATNEVTRLVNLPATATGVSIPTSAIGLVIGKFLGTTATLDLRLSAGESLGMTKIVSAPKVLTLDNKAAKIEQGSQVPFQTTSLQGTQTTFVDATLTLNVTPHVIPHANTVRLEIKATKNSVGAAVSNAGPTIDKKEATTEVLLRDGETTVLGGIFEESRTDSTQGIPWFNRIPFLGWLFKNEGVSVSQTELLVFVTPTIIKD